MNERIRELLVKAEIEIKARRPALDEEPDGYVESDNDFMGNNCEAIIRLLEEGGLEKFAELIIQECADIAKHNVMNISTYADAEFVEEQIQKHFGVEE